MNLANRLTVLRIILVPVFLIFIDIKGIPYGITIATGIFIIAALTDKLDGYIARSRNQITRFGKLMDPLADKLLVSAALISLVELGTIYSWVAVIIIAREFAVTGLRSVAASDGIVIAASWWGKIKTVIQIVAIIIALVNVDITTVKLYYSFDIVSIMRLLTDLFIGLATIVTVISGLEFFVKNKQVFATDK
jgi:CDP-diacylglycerol--glycerol-3-phosphate 3-phosphatidyltransferase